MTILFAIVFGLVALHPAVSSIPDLIIVTCGQLILVNANFVDYVVSGMKDIFCFGLRPG